MAKKIREFREVEQGFASIKMPQVRVRELEEGEEIPEGAEEVGSSTEISDWAFTDRAAMVHKEASFAVSRRGILEGEPKEAKAEIAAAKAAIVPPIVAVTAAAAAEKRS